LWNCYFHFANLICGKAAVDGYFIPPRYSLHEEEGRTYKSITAEYGVSKASISKWCSEFSKECQTNPKAQEDYDSMKENLRLKRENEELRKEIAFLKKAAAFFAKEID
jgi:transposase